MESDLASIKNGDVALLEEYLYSQTVALQKMFEMMILNCVSESYPEARAIYGKLALKAQSQCRTTISSLATLRNPKQAMFIQQQNNAINQQVNTKVSAKNSNKQKKNNKRTIKRKSS